MSEQVDAAVPAEAAEGRLRRARVGIGKIIRGILDADSAAVEKATLELSARSKWLAPLAFAAGAVAMTVVGVKPLLRNWRLTIIEFVPAGWLWLSMYNLKHHTLDGTTVKHMHLFWFIPVAALYIGLAVLAFWCNAMFAVSLANNDRSVRHAARAAWVHRPLLIRWGVIIGVAHAIVAIFISRIGPIAYDLCLMAVIVVSMITFVSVPASIAGVRKRKPSSRRDQVAHVAVSSAMAAVVSTPGFICDRIGLLLIATRSAHWLGFALLSIGIAFQMAGTTSTRAVKLSSLLVNGEPVVEATAE